MTPAGSTATFDELARAADAAAHAAGGYSERFFVIGHLPARVRFAGPLTLERFVSPLAHLRSSPARDARLTVSVCQGDGCGVPMPDGPWRTAAGTGRPVRGTAAQGGFFLGHDGALTAYDGAHRVGYYWLTGMVRGNRRQPIYPLSPILAAWLAEHDTYLVPAAAVGRPGGGVLLAGGPGSGKSHAMHACVLAGLRYLGDDAVLLDSSETTIHSVYRTTHPSGTTLELMPDLVPIVAGPEWQPSGGHTTIFLDEHVRDALLTKAPLQAIAIIQRRSGSRTRLRSATPGEALAALAPWSLQNVPGGGQAMFERLSCVARATPAVHLECGRDPAGIAAALAGLLEPPTAEVRR